MIRVLVAEDHTIVREGIKQLIGLAKDLLVVGEASNGEQLLETLRHVPLWLVEDALNPFDGPLPTFVDCDLPRNEAKKPPPPLGEVRFQFRLILISPKSPSFLSLAGGMACGVGAAGVVLAGGYLQ